MNLRLPYAHDSTLNKKTKRLLPISDTSDPYCITGAVGIRIGECRTPGSLAEAKVAELALAAPEPSLDFAQRFGLGELAEHHRDELIPAAEAFGSLFGASFGNEALERVAVYLAE